MTQKFENQNVARIEGSELLKWRKKLSKNAPNLTENLQFITISTKNTQKIK